MRQGFRIDEGRIHNPGLRARHRITWQRKAVTSQNDYGENVYTWTDVMSTPAQIRQPQGRELEGLQQRWAEARYMVVHHFYPGLTEEMRIQWTERGTTRYLDVVGVTDEAGTSHVTMAGAKEWRS